MSQRPQHKIVVPSRLGAAAAVQQRVLLELAKLGYSDNAQFAVRLAMDEATCNAIRHGNRNDPRKTLTFEYAVDRKEARIWITDQGQGFEPRRVPDPTARKNLDRPCGRGVMLIRSYMSRVRYSRGGRRILMVKLRRCPKPTDPPRRNP
jgi:serine/threonine-protein kinase RsbW